MTRRKITLSYISNDAERRASYRKRKKGLIKKVSELSGLCDVQACAIIYGPYDQEPEVWPSRAGVLAVLERYRRLSDVDKSRKMVNLESFTRQRVQKAEEQLCRVQKENDRRELKGFMFKCLSGYASAHDFDLRNMAEMRWMVDQSLRDITSIDGRKTDRRGLGHTSGTAAEVAEAPAAETGDGYMEACLLNYICNSAPEWGLVPHPNPNPYIYYDNGNDN